MFINITFFTCFIFITYQAAHRTVKTSIIYLYIVRKTTTLISCFINDPIFRGIALNASAYIWAFQTMIDFAESANSLIIVVSILANAMPLWQYSLFAWITFCTNLFIVTVNTVNKRIWTEFAWSCIDIKSIHTFSAITSTWTLKAIFYTALLALFWLVFIPASFTKTFRIN